MMIKWEYSKSNAKLFSTNSALPWKINRCASTGQYEVLIGDWYQKSFFELKLVLKYCENFENSLTDNQTKPQALQEV